MKIVSTFTTQNISHEYFIAIAFSEQVIWDL